jgi:hypothetical protein
MVLPSEPCIMFHVARADLDLLDLRCLVGSREML